MRARPLLRCGLAALVLVLASGALVASSAHAAPDCDGDNPPPVCDPEPPPPPGPVARNLRLYVPGDNDAVPVATAVMNEVLDRVAPANRSVLAGKTVTVHVIPGSWDLTELPRWQDKRGQDIKDDPYERSYDEIRGVAGSNGSSLDAAAGEETLFVPRPINSPVPAEALLGNVLTHELGHLVKAGLTRDQGTRLTDLRIAARQRFKKGETADIIGHGNDLKSFEYTTWNDDEFFAEGTAAWFERNDGGRYLRSWVRDHDPGLYALLDEVYDVPPAPRYCERHRATKVLRAGAGNVSATPGPDVIVGTSGRDVIFAGDGDDLVCAGGGNDAVSGEQGNDRLRGESGPDSMAGGAGDDGLVGAAGEDILLGEAGNDYLIDDIPGNPGQAPEPGDGDDHMEGGPGNDRIYGGTGGDSLTAGTGIDALFGGDGEDHLSVQDGHGDDLVDGEDDFDLCSVDDGDDRYRCALRIITEPSLPPGPPPEIAPDTTTTTRPTTTTTRPATTTTVPPPRPGDPPRHEP